MTIQLYGHPFAAFVWKALIAAYERNVPFTFRMVGQDHPENLNRMAQLLQLDSSLPSLMAIVALHSPMRSLNISTASETPHL